MSYKRTRSSRHLQPSPSKKSNTLLNVLIGVVVVLIVLTASYVIKWQNNIEVAQIENPEVTNPTEDEGNPSEDESGTNEEESTDQEETQTDQQTAVESISDDPIVDRVITDESWQTTPTTQTGAHVSSFDPASIDWQEKVATITSVTGVEEDKMIIWYIGNNGSPETAIATVSTKDLTQMYRVSMKWIDDEGWLPVKLEVLNTVEGAY